MRNKGRRNPIQRDEPAGKWRKMREGKYLEMTNNRKKPEMRINEEKKREKDEKEEEDKETQLAQPKRKKLRQMKIGETRDETNRYSEFGEEERWEYYDWEGKMEK